MFFRMVYDDKLAQAAYLIGCQKTGEAVVIDPERDIDRYEALAAANGLRIVAATETHIHADFVSGVREFAEKGVKVYLSDEGDADWKYSWPAKGSVGGGSYNVQFLKSGDVFSVGNVELKAVHTPGHTPEHLSFTVTDRGAGADKPLGVATGDFVFVGDLGRPDLLETAAGVAGQADASAKRLYKTVREFAGWPDYMQVWPGHGAGSACGKALGAVPQSTVGYEKMFNPSVKAAGNEAQFVAYMLGDQPEPPVYFARMKRVNKEGVRVLGGVPKPARLDAAVVKGLDGRSCAIVDTRVWAVFKAGHLAGALYVPLMGSYSTEAGSMIGEDEKVYLVVEPGRVDEAVRGLIRVGIDNIAGWIDAGQMEQLAAAGVAMETSDDVTAAGVLAKLGEGVPFILDARRKVEFAEGHIPGAANIAHTRLLANMAGVPKDRPVVVNCQSGGRSARACSLLQKHGYTVANLAGGFSAWAKAGGPVQK